jgi:uncharacterized protein
MGQLSESGHSWWDRFQTLLDEQMEWPGEYIFKFIAPRTRLDDLKALFGGQPVKVRSSSRGNYVSVTARMELDSSDQVIAIYNAAAEIEGVISL